MKKIIITAIFSALMLYAADYATMSTEDLLSMRGSVPAEDQAAFQSELQSRVSAMTTEEKESLGIGKVNSDGSGDGTMTQTRTRTRTNSMNSFGNMSSGGMGMGGGMGGRGGGGGGRR